VTKRERTQGYKQKRQCQTCKQHETKMITRVCWSPLRRWRLTEPRGPSRASHPCLTMQTKKSTRCVTNALQTLTSSWGLVHFREWTPRDGARGNLQPAGRGALWSIPARLRGTCRTIPLVSVRKSSFKQMQRSSLRSLFKWVGYLAKLQLFYF